MFEKEKLFCFHFKFNEQENKCICRHCNKNFEGKNDSNLKRHLMEIHPSHANDTNIQYNRRKRTSTNDVDEDEVPAKKFKKLKNEDIIQICVEFVTKHLLPYNFFSFSPLKKLMQGTGTNMTINPKVVKGFVDFSAQKIKEIIQNEVKNQMISLKVDLATRLGRSILGINIQFFSMIENKVVIRTIGMIEITKKHSAENIHTIISKTLNDYGIDKRQICSFTSDNGANIIATGKKFQEHQNSLLLSDEMENMVFEQFNEEDEDSDNFDDEGPSELPLHIQDALKDITSIAVLLRCSVHTLQLAIHDAIKEIKRESGIELEDIRKVVKNFKSSTYSEVKHILNLKSPGIDVCTRWNSSFIMIHKLINMKTDFMKVYEYFSDAELEAILLDDTHWDFMAKFHQAFLPCYRLTINLQKTNLSMGNQNE